MNRTRAETYKPIATGIVKVFRGGRFVGYRAVVWVVDRTAARGGRLAPKRFPRSATLTEMKTWREDTRRAAQLTPAPAQVAPEHPDGFAGDAATYLETVKAMPSIKDRRRHILDWVAVFGDTPHEEISSTRIRAQRDRWLTDGPKRVQERQKDGRVAWVPKPIPLSPSSVNNRLRALENLWTVMWPKHPNPVREVDEASEPDPLPRGQTFALALEILSHMRDVTRPVKGGAVEPGSLSRIRFEAMLWTGLPAVQLAHLTPEMIDWDHGTFVPPKRLKGRSSRRARSRVRPAPRPLLPQAVAALKQLFARKANRPFSSTSINRAVRAGIRAANVVRAERKLPPIPEHFTVYELTRHTFGTETFRTTKNLKAVQDLLGHHDIAMSERYALSAVREHLVTAITELTARAQAADVTARGG